MSLNFLFRGFENLKENKEYSRIGEKPDKLKLAVKTQVHVRINSCFFSDLLIGILNDEMPNFTILHPFHQIDYQKFEKTLLWKNPYFIGPSLLKFIVLVLKYLYGCCLYDDVACILRWTQYIQYTAPLHSTVCFWQCTSVSLLNGLFCEINLALLVTWAKSRRNWHSNLFI